MKRLSKYRRALLVSFLLCTGAACGISLWQMSFRSVLLSWANGCFAAAVLWCGTGALVLISLFGGFDSFSYVSHRVRRRFSRHLREASPKQESYFEYCRRRSEERWDKFAGAVLLLPGAVYLAAAVVLAVLC